MTTPNNGVVPGSQVIQPKATEEVKLTRAEEIENERGLKAPYTDVRKITISLISDIKVASVYRQVNAKFMDDRRDNIGSSVNSTRTLMGGSEELKEYMPPILGIAANHPDFITRVKAFFDNMSIPVTGDGKELNCTFMYRHYEDYLAVQLAEEAIDKAYEDADKSDTKKLKAALEIKINDLNRLESTKYRFGKPENLEHYIVYRHCLLYPHVAKDIAVVAFNSSVRFYIKDESKELIRAQKRRTSSNKAKRNFLDCLDDSATFRSIFVLYCVSRGLNVLSNLQQDDAAKQSMLDDYSMKEPDKFNALFGDRNVKLRAFIEEAIAKGELYRSDINQNILSPEGQFIGSNMKETIAYFQNPANADFKKSLEMKLKF